MPVGGIMVFKIETTPDSFPSFKKSKIINLDGNIRSVRPQPDQLFFLPVFQVIAVGPLQFLNRFNIFSQLDFCFQLFDSCFQRGDR